MIDFLLKSTISLSVFLGFYHLVLEREKMHQFNRFYLLFSIIISLAIPYITFEIIKIVPVVQNFEPLNTIITSSAIPENEIQGTSLPVEENINFIPYVLWSLYGLIGFLLLLRFGKNIWKLIAKSKSNPIVKYKNANLVLVEEKTLPHTFLNSIFINFDDYNNRNIEDELYTHELVHVTQKHTLDILFIEFLKVIFWFNPLFILYKKAIQLNHEFLADEEIVKTYNNVPFYQNLLLQKSSEQTIYLASNLNYLVTKKRLIMMTKSTSQKIALLKKVAIVPILAGLIYFFCIEIVAQEKVINTNSEKVKSEITDKDKIRDSYYSGVYVKICDEKTKRNDVTLYENLSLADRRKYLDFIPEMMIEKEIPEPLFEKMKTKDMAVWINGKVKNKEEIKKYKRTDFSYYTYSFVHKNARTKRFPQEHQYTLYTKDYFDENLKNSHVHFSGDTIKISMASYKTAMQDKVIKKLNPKADTLVWFTEGKEGYNLYLSDENDKIDPETTVIFRSKKGAIVLKKKYKELTNEQKKLIPPSPPKKSKSGKVEKPKNEIIIDVSDENTEKIHASIDDKDLKIRQATPKEIEEVNYKKDITSLNDLDKGTQKSGYLYMNNATYFFVKNDDNIYEYYNRWGFRVNEKGEKI
jgi:beta-lactamase regulating signal transducer with metallopeptidase domain